MMATNYKGFPDPSLVLSVEEARELLGSKDVIFVDTRNYWKYAKGHIPGAFNLELYAFHWADTSRKGVSLFARQMSKLVSSIGITSKSSVIFYQNNSGYDAARGVWLLHFLGHRKSKLVDGGLNLWKKRRYPLSTLDPIAPKESRFKSRIDSNYLATMNMLSKSIGNEEGIQIIDSRSSGEYKGKFKRAKKFGHIPGSLNVEWKQNLRRDGTLKSARELQKLYRVLKKDKETITYCQSGYRAAHSWLVLRLLGFANVKNYLGSWYEWGNEARTRVVRR